MCDYSLQFVANRPAKVGDKLISSQFVKSFTRGFTEVGEPGVAVCLLPGTELVFDHDVECDHVLGFFPNRSCARTWRAFGRSIWTIPMSITTRSNSRAARWSC